MEVDKSPSFCENPVKIFIKDFYTLDRDSTHPNYYSFCGELIRKVDIMGVVTEVRTLRDVHLYRVDDGTGTVLCRHNHFKAANVQRAKEIELLQDAVGKHNYQMQNDSGMHMELLLEEMYQAQNNCMTALEQGDSVHICGFINTFHGSRDINVFAIYKMHSIMNETDRIFELSDLYSKVYLKLKG